MTEFNRMKPHGSMPILTGEGPYETCNNGVGVGPVPMQTPNHFPSPTHPPSSNDPAPNLTYPTFTSSGSYPTPPATPASTTVQSRNEHVDRFVGTNFTRHKSDSNLIRSLLREEASQSPTPLLPASHPSPSQQHSPRQPHSHQSASLSQSYSIPSSASVHSKIVGKQWGHSLPADAFRKQRAAKMPYSPSSPKTVRSRKHVSTNIPPNVEVLPSYPLSPMHYNNQLKGSTSSLPDLTNADFHCGLTTPIDRDEQSMESSVPTGEDSAPLSKDFDSNLPTWQVPQAAPKKISTYSNPEAYVHTPIQYPSPLSPLVDKPSMRPTRSQTVSSFSQILDDSDQSSASVLASHDDSVLGYSPVHRSVSDTHGTPFPQDHFLPHRPSQYPPIHARSNVDQKMSYGPPGHMNSSSSKIAMDSTYPGASSHSLPLNQSFKFSQMSTTSCDFTNVTRVDANLPSGFPGSLHQQHQSSMKHSLTVNTNTQYYSYTTDNIPSSSARQPAKRPPPSYYDHQHHHQEPTSIIQERMSTNLSLGQDLTRSWSEENLFLKNPVQKEKGSPLHNPFMGTMAASSSVPCVHVDPVDEMLASLIEQEPRHTSGSPHSPTDSTSTEVHTPPATIRFEQHPPFTGQINEWPMDQSRRDTLVAGQYRSLTDLTSILNAETGPVASTTSQKAPQSANSTLSHQHSLPCLQNYEELLDGIDANMPFFDPADFPDFLKQDQDPLSLGLQQYQPMD